MAATQVILLEKVEKLGQMGDVVSVKPGFARNYLLPQNKALRATKANVTYFEAEKKALMAESDKKMKEAMKQAKKLDGVKVSLIRQASESGQLFGSVTSRDIAVSIAEQTGETITKTMVSINRNFKMIGLFPVDVYLHPEVKTEAIINIARTSEEAEIQAKSGKALIAEASLQAEPEATEEQVEAQSEEEQAALEDVLEDSALEIEKEKSEAAEEDAKKQAESDEKSVARQAKKAEKKATEDAEAEAVATEIGEVSQSSAANADETAKESTQDETKDSE